MMKRFVHTLVLVCAAALTSPAVYAQTSSPAARPWGRISFFTNSWQTETPDAPPRNFTELTTSLSYQLPERDDNGLEYGLDMRYSAYTMQSRPERASIYEGYVGRRFASGHAAVRLGHMWLNDLGSLGSVAGALIEVRQTRLIPEDGRFRAGLFTGFEPKILETGYADGVTKFGGYLAYDGDAARRHSVGYVLIKDGFLIERSVITTSHFIPAGRKLYVYQAAEFDIQAPAGQAHSGLAYTLATVRVLPHDRLELQGTYNRGRSVDARGLSEDLLAGRALTPMALEGLLYESIGGRATVEVVRRVRIYGGYARDKNNRDTEPSGRTVVGGHAANVAGSGLDISASDSLLERANGSYHSRYVSVGRQAGRNVYVSGDYSTSLSVVQFSRSDGIIVESRPHTTRYSGTATINVGRAVSLLATVERTQDDQVHEFRLLSGITYRLR